MKNRIFADLKSAIIQIRRIELKFAGKAALSVTNIKPPFEVCGTLLKNRAFSDPKSASI